MPVEIHCKRCGLLWRDAKKRKRIGKCDANGFESRHRWYTWRDEEKALSHGIDLSTPKK